VHLRGARHSRTPADAALTVRTREVMFRIGGEEDLLDRPTAVPVSAPQPSHTAVPTASQPLPATARAACPPDAGTPPASATAAQPPESPAMSEAAVLDVPAPDAPARGSPARPADDVEPSPVTVLHAPVSPRLPDLDRQDPATARGCSISQDDVPTVVSPLRRRRLPPHHQGRDTAVRRHRSTVAVKGRQRPRLAKLQSCIAWVNALIFTVLVVAAVIGHTPASTTAAGSEPSTAQAAARPVAPLPSTRLAGSKVLPGPRVREHRACPSRSARPHLTLPPRPPEACRVASSAASTPSASHPGARDAQGNTSIGFSP
jgi:hypothetical protein